MKKAFLQLHLAVFLAGFTAILGKLIELNEGLLVWYRLLFSAALILIILVVKKQLHKIALVDFFRIGFVGMILAFHWVTFYASVKYANASVAVVCISAAGFFSALLEPLFFRKAIVWIELILGAIAVAGIYIIFDFHPHFKVGILFGMLSAIGSATFPIFNKRLVDRFSPRVLTFYEFVGGMLFLTAALPLYFMYFPPHYYLPTSTDWLWMTMLVVFCTVWAFDLQLNALKKISAFTSNLTYNLEPLYGVLLAFLVFKEHQMLNAQFYLGIGLILLAILLQMWRVLRKS
jgi:drug/metabolite transporter (DMT)-like permease